MHSNYYYEQMIVDTQIKMLNFLKKYNSFDNDFKKLIKNFFDFKTRVNVRDLLVFNNI